MSGWTGPLRTSSSLSVWQQLREAAVPVSLYWIAVIYSFSCFAGVILVTEGPGGENLVFLAAFGLCTALGVALGQLFAFLRVRTWLLLTGGAVCWTVFFTIAAAGSMATGGNPVVIFLVVMLFILPIAMTGGLWSLETHRALWSTWLPLLYGVGAVIAWTENTGRVSHWFAGQKWAIWDFVSFGILAFDLLLVLAYLLTRETHRLALWKRGPMAPLQPILQETGATRPRITLGGCAILLVLTGVIALSTALVAPYLWRTAPGDRESPADGPTGNEPPPPEVDSEFMKRLGEVLEKMAEAAQDAGGVVCGGLTALFLLTLLVMGLWRPLKRLMLVRHLRDPFWAESPTTRIEQGWRLVEIALADVGIHPRPGEDAAGLARRAAPVLAELSPVEVHGLEDAAAVADRVRFGLGVTESDARVMERFARWVHDTVWERLGDWAQLRAMYRGID